MADFIRSSLLRDHTMATEVKKIDLPTNPLSHLIISIDGYNGTDEATLAEILAFINKIDVSWLGTSIVSLQSEDLAAQMAYLYGSMPVLTQNVATDNAARCLSLIVPFGRKIFNGSECFPATKKGELTLSIDTTVPATSFDNAQMNVESVELLGVTPQQYLKSTQIVASAPGATGANDIDLPIGNPIACVQMRMTTFPTTSSHTYGVDSIKILRDNVEYGYSFARAQCMVGEKAFRINTLPRDIAAFGNELPPNVIWLDYDPAKDDNYLLITEGLSALKVRMEMGVDEATTLNVMELVSV